MQIQIGELLAATSLAPGISTTGTKTMIVTQAMLDAGSQTNIAIATGKPPTGNNVTAADTQTVEFIQQPGLAVSKVADKAAAEVGDTITYTITIQNTGNVTLNNITVIDPMLGSELTGFVTTMAPGAKQMKKFTYVVKSTDHGTLTNTVYVSGTPPGSTSPVDDSASAQTTIQKPGILVTKTADKTIAAVGDVITYTITITNTGDVTLNNITVTDPLLGGTLLGFPTSMAVDGQFSKTFTYTVKPNNVTPLVNAVTVTAIPEGFTTPVSSTDDVSVCLTNGASIDVTKSADKTVTKCGNNITYTITVTNPSQAPLENITVTDSLLGDLSGAFTGTLAPSSSITRTFIYHVTLSDKNPLVNKVTVTATPACSTAVVTDSASAVVNIVCGILPGKPGDLVINNASYSNPIGYGIFNTTGTNEVQAQTTSGGTTINYPITLVNNYSKLRTFLIKGNGNIKGWKVRYFDVEHGNRDITTQVTGSGFDTGVIYSQDTYRIILAITPDATLAPVAKYQVSVRVNVKGELTVSDAVQAVTTKQ